MTSTPSSEELKAYQDRCERRRVDARWRDARTFEEVLGASALYVKGELSVAPYYRGPLERDSRRLREGLLAMHDHGLLTIGGQAPLRRQSYRLGPKGERWWDVCQRAYVEFYVQRDSPVCEKLLRRLPGAKGLKYDVRCKQWHHRICNFTGRLPVTWERRDKERSRLAKKRWKACTRSPCTCHPDHEVFHPVLASAVSFFVANASTHEGALEQKIVTLCQ